MYKLWHFLFGWHYVWVYDCNDHHIVRVTKMPDGCLWGKISFRNFWIDQNGKIHGGYAIHNWKPLTWKLEVMDD